MRKAKTQPNKKKNIVWRQLRKKITINHIVMNYDIVEEMRRQAVGQRISLIQV